jgi:hypothetical protein
MKNIPEVQGTVSPKEPKRFKIPSSSYGITCADAADTLLRAAEIKANKPLYKEALADLKKRKAALSSVTDEASPVDEGEDENY